MSEHFKDRLDNLERCIKEKAHLEVLLAKVDYIRKNYAGEPIKPYQEDKQARVYAELAYQQIAELTERWHTLNRAYCILQMCPPSNTLTKRSSEYQRAMNAIRDRLLAISPPC